MNKIMCLYPRFIKNKTYYSYISKIPSKGMVTAKPLDDYRKQYVPIGCGNCIECRKQNAQEWRVRLMEHIKARKYAYFVTLTFSNESLEKLCEANGVKECNAIAVKACRMFFERWRKTHKKSIEHWLITELGHENTERIHLHGILFTEDPLTNDKLEKYWKYGRTDIGQYCNEQTINYIVKYVTKIDKDHKQFKPQIICSAGIGRSFLDKIHTHIKYQFKGAQTAEDYTYNNGQKVALPIYYRNKLFTHAQRDELWTHRLNKNEIYVNGIRIRNVNTNEGYNDYISILKTQQNDNINLGYGDTSNEWKEKDYNVTFKMLNRKKDDFAK